MKHNLGVAYCQFMQTLKLISVQHNWLKNGFKCEPPQTINESVAVGGGSTVWEKCHLCNTLELLSTVLEMWRTIC